jgi:type II secretory pathway pseudopilin PulG
LPELLIAISVIAVVAGMVLPLLGGVQADSEKKLLQSELTSIRGACLRFKVDMGEAPKYLAELMQPPGDLSSKTFLWRWRPATWEDENHQRLWRYDPATRRGWNGPYLKAEFTSGENQPFEGELRNLKAKEWRIERERNAPGGYVYDAPCDIGFDDSASKDMPLSIILSNYETLRQVGDEPNGVVRRFSHYLLITDRNPDSDQTELFVAFVCIARDEHDEPYLDTGDPTFIVHELGLGIEPNDD